MVCGFRDGLRVRAKNPCTTETRRHGGGTKIDLVFRSVSSFRLQQGIEDTGVALAIIRSQEHSLQETDKSRPLEADFFIGEYEWEAIRSMRRERAIRAMRNAKRNINLRISRKAGLRSECGLLRFLRRRERFR